MLRAMAAIWYAWCGLLAAVSVIAGVLIPLKVGGQGKALTFLTMALGSAAFFVTIILVSRKFFIQPMIKKLENIEKDVD